jgi:hypothetical protein
MDALVFADATKLEPTGTLSAFRTSSSVPGGGSTTFLSVTGAGWLSCLTLTGGLFSLRITLDGGTASAIPAASLNMSILPGIHRFTTSLLVEVTNSSTTNTATVSGVYVLR